jgi:phosphoribosylaminoimidazolecarboxamide formyltransferase/IMP cyclohydrolase
MVRAMSSNAIAIGGVDGGCVRLFGGGVGQVDRVTACRLAVEKARAFSPELLSGGGAIAVSDAFFPFDDGPRVLIEAGVKMIVHPGGSKRDADTFALCERAGVTCMITGVRRFRH